MKKFSNASTRRDHCEELTQTIIAKLEEGVMPWRKPWDASKCAAANSTMNPTTGRFYRGINALALAMAPFSFTSGDPRWCSYKQADQRGWQVRKGEKGTIVFFYKKLNIKDENQEDRTIPLLRAYTAMLSAALTRALTKPAFSAGDFTPTKWNSAKDKADFANALMKFVAQDFPRTKFHNAFYRRLSNTFGNIAHYDRDVFYETFFLSAKGKITALEQCVSRPCFGDPTYTYRDVERAVIARLRNANILTLLRQIQIGKEDPYRPSWIFHPAVRARTPPNPATFAEAFKQIGKPPPSPNAAGPVTLYCGNLGSGVLFLRATPLQIERENHKFVDLEVTGACSDVDLALIDRLAHAESAERVGARRRGAEIGNAPENQEAA
ncbi:protein of unknown function [Rhodoblastus acidophilus]|uniref:N-terminal domain-containing protein n=1 Tax=Rhodoblastus acidophilus TaxID=1074 RepID=A0A212SA16_RHOAC|nr:ArdC family protein [Rhodoblastus acidophilus]PPQ36056.1 DUF1738 domain-containing protein [Rhodoblastus acidophilus]RAI18797.1 DUF1738 domain-containing protein [Rhodoblastus acidophilus]SNB82188.1 protein of unknown function [Rhodoblastus acidophilus]